VSRLWQKHAYALRVNAKKKEAGSQPPTCDAQFHSIEHPKQAFIAAGAPILSMETKNKAWIGNFKNAGQAWRWAAEYVPVLVRRSLHKQANQIGK
jgi:hypothetical protein